LESAEAATSATASRVELHLTKAKDVISRLAIFVPPQHPL